MKFLKKVIVALALVILLAIIKALLIRRLTVSLPFYVNLAGCLQLLLLGWAVMTAFLESILVIRNSRHSGRTSFLLFLLFITTAEIFSLVLLVHPRFIPGKMLPAFRYYYNNYNRDILQYNVSISLYDTAVFYKMKPANKSVFRNIEFSDSIFTNKAGFRDDDKETGNEKIICLGDSYTLGWGVQQQETFVQQLENRLQLPVLNTGMSSYGTAREIRSVQDHGIKDAQAVIIQYCYNDDDENESYIQHGYHLPVSPGFVYDSACRSLEWSKRYFPGKTFFTICKIFLKEEMDAWKQRNQKKERDDYEKSARLFVEVLKRSGWDFSRIRVYVFAIGEYESLNDGFANALEKAMQKKENEDVFHLHVRAVRISSLLKPEDFYLLDAHIRPGGHAKIAQAFAEILQSQK